ncbi:glycosyltransferase family 4 protein [Mucilaginibacter ginsenosidivorans]|uniref:Glycosyltransferase family 4 protein n=1 Tax=Mucilaginibacter ginsenosidivorans TaxID=398053 RepID=A0A5B8UVF9_9SPHI|nr:glycosyltransferase family 4 protein [Mucilaginibacter ginsenosidivorans]QEC62426.1 glycosyltransferase family 4 protein [Mucilaginibacter ginsenosidivorans]
MKILFATGRSLYPFFRGGDGTTAAQMLSGLKRYGLECKAVGKLDPELGRKTLKEIESNLKLHDHPYTKSVNEIVFETEFDNHLIKSDFFENYLSRIIRDYTPDFVITQQEDSEKIIRLVKKYAIRCILYIHDCAIENFKSLEESPGYIFYNSSFVSDYFKARYNIPSQVIYPVVDEVIYKSNKVNPVYVTMVNPTVEKGSDILLECCQKLPSIPFQVVNGWRSDSSLLTRLQNVKILPFGTEMKRVYAETKFVIAPSQWDEPFCRIPVEAGLCHVPTIASAIGGLFESVSNGGILIKKHTDKERWLKEISDLYHNRRRIDILGNLAEINSQKFRLKAIIPQIIDRLALLNSNEKQHE